MHHNPATVEEQLILKAIREECPWENLPKRLQTTLSSKEEWHRRFLFCFNLPFHSQFSIGHSGVAFIIIGAYELWFLVAYRALLIYRLTGSIFSPRRSRLN